MESFGEGGDGIFAVPTVVKSGVIKRHGVRVIGRTEDVVERFYAITVERRTKNPAVVRIAESAKENLFSQKRSG